MRFFNTRLFIIHYLEGDKLNKIITAALLATITTPTMAKTKVYGELHASYDKIFTVGAESRDSFSLNNSIIGVKGSTEIKKDVSFIYQFSWGVSSNGFDDFNFGGKNNSGFSNLNQVIGVASPSGAVIVGRFDTPFKTLGRKADLFWHSQLGQNRNITNASDWDLRADKIIAFQSSIIKGFQGSIAYASDITDTSRATQNGSAISLNGFYRKGKLLLGAAYEQHDLDSLSSNNAADTNALRFSGVYKDGPLKMVGFYQNEDNDFAVTAKPDATLFGVGIAYKKGKRTLKAQLYNRDIDATSKDSTLIAIGYDYKVTKFLDMYAQAAKITNSASLGGYDLGDSTSIIADTHGISLGIKYKF